MSNRMKSILVSCAVGLALTSFGACWAQDVPFAQGGGAAPASSSLSDLMTAVLQRHALVWSAGGSGNWPFAAYEIGQMRSRFVDAASTYRNIPVDVVVAMTKALDELQASVDKKDKGRFEATFDAATGACNACHAAAGISFIRIRRPTTSGATNLNVLPVNGSAQRSR